MKKSGLTRRHWLLLLGAAALLAALCFFVFLSKKGIGIPCLFYRLTGLQCPGCGNSRAALALLQLDLPTALRYNLLFPLEFLYLGWVVLHCCRSYLRGGSFTYKSPAVWLDIALLAVIMLWWLIRNLL
jgi:hypothetical protein